MVEESLPSYIEQFYDLPFTSCTSWNQRGCSAVIKISLLSVSRTLKSITAFTPSCLSAVRSDVPIREKSALHGALACVVSGSCAVGVVGII